MKISFIGFGNMAKAIAQTLCESGKPYQIFAAAPSLKPTQQPNGILTHPDNLAILSDADIVILAVKPAKMATVLAQIKTVLPKHCLLISIAAGLNLAWLEQHCPKNQAIIRSMPNTPIAVGKGATPLMANSRVTKEQQCVVEELFQCGGLVVWINQEQHMDVFTALSGSGPAYVFLFLEAMMNAAERLGISEEIAKLFTLQTVSGALCLASSSELRLDELRANVTSPAGTTAAALAILKKQGFEELLFNAMKAAYERAQELGLLVSSS